MFSTPIRLVEEKDARCIARVEQIYSFLMI